MTLHVKNSGSWEEVTEIHYKKDGSWERVKEVYIKKDGQWETVLYEENTETITVTGAGTIDVPAGAFRALVRIEGGNGGKGGDDGNGAGGNGGEGASISAVIKVDPFTTLSYNIASGGGNGYSSGGGPGGSGGTGFANGGDGGRTGSVGWSGSGGGGGGASSLVNGDGDLIIVAAGGPGGGGAGNQSSIGQSKRNADNASGVSTELTTSRDGGDGQDCQTPDGAGAGGGGGGVAGIDIVTESVSIDSWGYQYNSLNTGLENIQQMRITSKRSSSACTLGYSYGFTGNTVWVNHGCRGTFRIEGNDAFGLGGLYAGPYDSDGYPGDGGQSFVNGDIVKEYSVKKHSSGDSGTDGKLTITWLPE